MRSPRARPARTRGLLVRPAQPHAARAGSRADQARRSVRHGHDGPDGRPGFTREWRLSDVVPERRFAITGFTPDGAGALSFGWEFEDEGSDGTRMTQRIQATGPEVEHHMTVFRQMELGAQAGMGRLAAELDRLAGDGGVGLIGGS
jgi:hypothetical protein